MFPHHQRVNLHQLCEKLNAVNWAELGFQCDGRYIFSQRSLEQTLLPESFAEFVLQPCFEFLANEQTQAV